MNNTLQPTNTNTQGRTKFSVTINTPGYQKLINNVLNDKKLATQFVSDICAAVSKNPMLNECDPGTIVSAGLVAYTLKLSIANELGQCYIVPYKDNKNNRLVAQFQLGYKGYLQLAMRTGIYKKLIVTPIKEGELIKWDALNEEIEVKLIDNVVERNKAKTIGYYAMFEYLNGFQKILYWSIEDMQLHATVYAPAYKTDIQKGWKNSFWSKNFDAMALKTMLRQLISKWGAMSTDFQTAYLADGAVLGDGGKEYVDLSPDYEPVNNNIVIPNDTIIADIPYSEDTGEVVEPVSKPKVEPVKQKEVAKPTIKKTTTETDDDDRAKSKAAQDELMRKLFADDLID